MCRLIQRPRFLHTGGTAYVGASEQPARTNSALNSTEAA